MDEILPIRRKTLSNQSIVLNAMLHGYTWRNFTFDIKKLIYNWLIEDYLTSRLKIVHSWKGVTIASEWLHNLACFWSIFTDLKQEGIFIAPYLLWQVPHFPRSHQEDLFELNKIASPKSLNQFKPNVFHIQLGRRSILFIFLKRTFKKNLSTKYWSNLLDFYILKRFFPRNLYDTKCILG